jgi:hypothetical protein
MAQSWKARVQEVYSSKEELEDYDSIYCIAERCGYRDAGKLWRDNPMIGGSVNPADFGLAKRER